MSQRERSQHNTRKPTRGSADDPGRPSLRDRLLSLLADLQQRGETVQAAKELEEDVGQQEARRRDHALLHLGHGKEDLDLRHEEPVLAKEQEDALGQPSEQIVDPQNLEIDRP